tara:strand:- start:254 stop:850 length:597 start_codon:yes stop_codon:yes gene_type:complete
MNKILNTNNIDEIINYINTNSIKKPILIVGMMGVGKSALGKILANRLNRDFYDLDENIEKKYNMKIYEIFKDYGEQKFRDIEHQEIKNINKGCSAIIATGGGAFTYERNINILNRLGITLWLNSRPETIIARLKKNINNRPLLKNVDIESYINNLIIKRNPLYAKANITVMSHDVSKNKMVNQLLMAIKIYLMDNKNG